MAVIGNSSTQQAFIPAIDYFSGNGSTTAFTLSRPVASVAQVQVTIDNVAQNPSSAYTVSSNTITFTSAPLSGTNNIYVYYTSPITQVIAPGQSTVGLTQLSATGTASSSTYLRGDNTWATVASPSAATPTVLGTVYGKTDTSNLTFLGYQSGNSNSGAGNTGVGTQALYGNTTGTYNTAVGISTMVGTQTGSYNDAFGWIALNANTSGTSNAAFGNRSLTANTTGSNNTGIGVVALGANTTGSQNTGIGLQALQANTTGGNNTAVGYQAAYSNTSGGNTAIGTSAFYSNTSGNNATCVGYQAGYSNTTDTELTAFGYRAAFSNTTGSGGGRTTALGVQALEGNTTGYNNTAVGWRCLKSVVTGTANTAMGQQAGTNCTGNENLYLGNQCNTEATSGNGNTGLNAGYGGSRIFSLTSESNRFIAGHNGVSNAYVNVSWTVTSDARDKADVTASPYGLDFVTELRPVQYRWDRRSKYEEGQPDGTHKENKKQLGFLAQEVIALEKKYGAIDKDLLVADDEEDHLLKVTETKMIPVLVKAIQELKVINDTQAATITALTARITALENK